MAASESSDGTPAPSAELFVPTGVAADTLGNLFISDTGNNRLRYVNCPQAPFLDSTAEGVCAGK